MQFNMKCQSKCRYVTSLCVALCSDHARQPSTNDVLQVIAADLDGDGDVDLVATNRESARVVWYENLLVQATPAPLLDTTPSPDSNAAESATPSSSPMTSPANPTETPASSIDRTASKTKPTLIKGEGAIPANGAVRKALIAASYALHRSRAAHADAPSSDGRSPTL